MSVICSSCLFDGAKHVDVDSVQGLVAHLICSDLLSLSPLELVTLAACCCALSWMVLPAYSEQSFLVAPCLCIAGASQYGQQNVLYL